MPKKDFSLETNIYQENLILKAIEDFWDGFGIAYSEGGVLEITGEDEKDIQEVFREFANYLIALHSESV